MKSYLSAKINWLCSIMFTGGNNVEKMTRSCLLQWENVFLALVIVSPYIYQYIVLFFFFFNFIDLLYSPGHFLLVWNSENIDLLKLFSALVYGHYVIWHFRQINKL